ncbi:MAG: hypothetical protein AAF721_36705, partial [Myxococcota bacterium]
MRAELLGITVLLAACTTPLTTGAPPATTTTTAGLGGTDGTTSGGDGASGMMTPQTTGSGTTAADGDTTAGPATSGAVFDLGVPDMPRVQCLQCEIDLMTTQSNALLPTMGMPLFATAELGTDVVFGIGEADAGRIAVSGDGNVIYREGSCPLWEWLGDTGAQPPRVLCIGADWPCHGETDVPLEINHLHMYPGQLDYGGLTLPPEYEGDPAALHTDYDLVVYFAVLDFATNGWDFDLMLTELRSDCPAFMNQRRD